MNPIAQNMPRTVKFTETEEETAELRRHVREICEGAAFKGSQRSGQFLKHIVEQAIAGNFEALKERVIGIQLFGRSPSYDTGGDAIVRVTASDVRKRLLQHYGKYGNSTSLRLSLPLGSYIPVVHRAEEDGGHAPQPTHAPELLIPASQGTASPTQAPPPPVGVIPKAMEVERFTSRKWLSAAILFSGWLVAIGLLAWSHVSPAHAKPSPPPPWSVLLRPKDSLRIITSDPNIEKIERLSGQPISLSDYANQQYFSDASALPADILRFCRDYLRGDLTPTVDTAVVARIAALAQSSATRIDVQGARNLRLADVYTDENFVFLGSPRSNRWASLFSEQLDFRFALKDGQEAIRNMHPRANEQPEYVPTAAGYATGQSFATISFLANPGRSGHVLLLAGANAEGTAAAGELITDARRLAAALKNCGIEPSGFTGSFQLLLGLNTMAGSPSHVKVLSCHVLTGGA